MTEVTLTVDKDSVLTEVAKTTSYVGKKMDGDDDAYDRIFTTDADREMLERFWSESQIAVCEQLKKQLADEQTKDNGDWEIKLCLSQSFDTTLENSMNKELVSFFVMNIVAKWFAFCNKKEAGNYGTAANELLVGVHKKALYKKRPTRPTYVTKPAEPDKGGEGEEDLK